MRVQVQGGGFEHPELGTGSSCNDSRFSVVLCDAWIPVVAALLLLARAHGDSDAEGLRSSDTCSTEGFCSVMSKTTIRCEHLTVVWLPFVSAEPFQSVSQDGMWPSGHEFHSTFSVPPSGEKVDPCAHQRPRWR